MSKYLWLDGSSSKPLFLINEIQRTLAPPLTVPLTIVPHRAGAIASKTEIGVREISVRITILADSDSEIRSKYRSVVAWAFRDRDSKLAFSDTPDVYINARLHDSTDVDEVAKTGEATLTFIAVDPFWYREEERSLLVGETLSRTFANNGTYKTFPRFRVVPHGWQQRTNFKIVNTRNNKQLLMREVTAWQPFIIDTQNNTVYRESDNVRLFKDLDVSSTFFALETGENPLAVSIDGEEYVDVRVIYRERYL